MTLREYLQDLNDKVAKNPEMLDYIVVYSNDEEGNWFAEQHNHASTGYYADNEFIVDPSEYYDETELHDIPARNAVCVN